MMDHRSVSKTMETLLGSPQALRRIFEEQKELIAKAAEALKGRRRVFLAGSGTSYHAAWAGSHMLRSLGGLDAFPIQAFDLALYPPKLSKDDAIIIISHRGTKRYSVQGLELARKAGALLIGITGRGSGLPEADVVIQTVEQENSSAHTASYLGSLTVLAQMALASGGTDTSPLEAIISRTEKSLAREGEVHNAAGLAVMARRIIVVGAGPNAPTAAEAALKLNEMAHLPAQSYELETFLHGPLAAVEKEDMVLTVTVDGPSLTRMQSLHAALKILEVPVWNVGYGVEGVPGFELPGLPAMLSPLLTVVPFQLLAHRAAVVNGVNPDVNRRDEDRYKRAMAVYEL